MNLHTDFRPQLIAPNAFIAEGVRIVGDVTIEEESSIWYNAVLRGDCETIRVGRQSNVQDNCVLHADFGLPCILGERVSVGHGAIVHGAIVEDDVLIGMNAVVMNGARVGRGSIIAVGAVVTEHAQIAPGSVVMGVPGRVVRAVTPDDTERIRYAYDHYVQGTRIFLQAAKRED